VLAFLAAAGERVVRGQPLAVMEAMKMEHTLAAPGDGVVTALRFAPGEQVGEGEALLDFSADAKAPQ
jgi:3-methylcrotonyl-CoA carboxylase alpha subunit